MYMQTLLLSAYTAHTYKPLSLLRLIKVELWAQEVGQMERAASLGRYITESMFVFVCQFVCAPERERIFLLKYDVMFSSASR